MDKFALEIPLTPMITVCIHMEAEWRCVVVRCTTQCVMKDGLLMTLQSSVGMWVMAPPTTVSGILIHIYPLYVSSLSATGAETAVNGEFGFLDETSVIRNPMCNGSEYQLSDCEGYALNNVDGDYCLIGSHQVGVVCVEGKLQLDLLHQVINGYLTVCYDGQMRFGNSTGSYDNGVYTYGGRVEVCSGEVYSPVCDEGWTNNDAAVVCRYMGYGSPYYREWYTYL